jgi:hypothetical protein
VNTEKTPPIWRPLPTKLRAYEVLHWLNRSFEAALLSIERLEQLGMFRLEYLNAFKVQIEHTRALANEEILDTLQRHGVEESGRFDGMQRNWENARKDPDDAFFHAQQRKKAIKEQIKELQNALRRERGRRQSQEKKR